MGGFNNFSKNVFPQVKFLIDSNKSFTWVEPELPWSHYERKIENRNVWSEKESLVKVLNAALSKSPKISSSKEIRVIVAGHSRGGKAIARAAKSGDLCKVNPSWVIWSDATYGDWLKTTWLTCLRTQKISTEVWFLKNTSTAEGVSRLLKILGDKTIILKPLSSPWYHGKIGEKVLTMSEALSD